MTGPRNAEFLSRHMSFEVVLIGAVRFVYLRALSAAPRFTLLSCNLSGDVLEHQRSQMTV